MAKNKFITLVSSLSDHEWSSLKRHILIKTKDNSDIFKLFKYIMGRKEKWPHLWETDKVHQTIFKKIEKKTFQNMLSTLFLWSEEWLWIQSVQENELSKSLQLVKAYTQKGLYELAEKHTTKVEKILNSKNIHDYDVHKIRTELYHTLYFSNNPIKYQNGTELLKKLISANTNYKDHVNHLYSAEISNWSKLSKDDFSFEKDILEKQLKLSTLPESHLLRLLQKMIIEYDVESYSILKNMLLTEKWDTNSEIHIILTSYLNIWALKLWQKGNLSSTKDIKNLTSYALASGVYSLNGRLPERRFHNIAGLLAALNEFDWCLNFIDQWKHKVNAQNPEDNVQLALAQCKLYEKKYDEITPILRSIKFKSSGQQTRLQGIQLIALFEDSDENPNIFLQYAINFRKYLKRNSKKISKNSFENHWNLTLVLEALYKGKNLNNLEEFISSNNLIYRVYIKEKMGA